MCFTGLSSVLHVCVCAYIWIDIFYFLICGSAAFQTSSLEVACEGCYSAFVCMCVYSINKWPNEHPYRECDVFLLIGFAFGVQQLHPALIQRPFG